jgi:AcrR family transcriptional regulator
MARPPQDPQIRINEILDAAEPLFYAKGYNETAINEIAKKVGVVEGTLYYYFKSKEEILEALVNRHIAAFISEIEPVVYSNDIIPPIKFNLLIQAMFRTVQHHEGRVLFGYLYNDKTLHLMEKISRQGKLIVIPLIRRIIEEGVQHNFFHVSHPQAVLNIILGITQTLTDLIYEKAPDDLIRCQFKLAEELIEKALGVQPGAIRILVNL